MLFDLSHLSVPFRMQPGLTALREPTKHLTALQPDSDLYRERLHSRHQAGHCLPGWDDAPVRQTLVAIAQRQGISCPPANASDFWLQLSLCVEEDFAVLDTHSTRLPFLHICNPTRWAPEEKLGLSFAQLHTPVAEHAALLRAAPALMQLLSDGRSWERFVWTITPSAHYDLHPHRQLAPQWPHSVAVEQWGRHCYLRVERQTFFPLRSTLSTPSPHVIFSIRVMREQLASWLKTTAHAQRLHASLQSMSDAVLHYKNLHAVQPALLAYLATRQNESF